MILWVKNQNEKHKKLFLLRIDHRKHITFWHGTCKWWDEGNSRPSPLEDYTIKFVFYWSSLPARPLPPQLVNATALKSAGSILRRIFSLHSHIPFNRFFSFPPLYPRSSLKCQNGGGRKKKKPYIKPIPYSLRNRSLSLPLLLLSQTGFYRGGVHSHRRGTCVLFPIRLWRGVGINKLIRQ